MSELDIGFPCSTFHALLATRCDRRLTLISPLTSARGFSLLPYLRRTGSPEEPPPAGGSPSSQPLSILEALDRCASVDVAASYYHSGHCLVIHPNDGFGCRELNVFTIQRRWKSSANHLWDSWMDRKVMREVRYGSRDIAATRATPKVASAGSRENWKRAATSEAPGSVVRSRKPPGLASVADFSPTHFIEPGSDNRPLLNAWNEPATPTAHGRANITTGASPMRLDPKSPVRGGNTKSAHEPNSSPLSHNPLVRGDHEDQTPLHTLGGTHSKIGRTRNSNAAWMRAEGFIPFGDDHDPVGFVPAQRTLHVRLALLPGIPHRSSWVG